MIQSLIDKLPATFLNSFFLTTTKQLTAGKNICVYTLHPNESNFYANKQEVFFEKHNKYSKVIHIDDGQEKSTTEQLDHALQELLSSKNISKGDLIQLFLKTKIILIIQLKNPEENVGLLDELKLLTKVGNGNISIAFTGPISFFKFYKKTELAYQTLFGNLLRLPNLNLSDIETVLRLLNEQFQTTLSIPISKKLLFRSGGNITLVDLFCNHLLSGQDFPKERDLMQDYAVKNYLKEIAVMIPKLTFDELLQTGMINTNGSLFSELFAKYLKLHKAENFIKTLFPKLTETDWIILSIFVQNPNTAIDKEQIALFLDQPINGDADWAIYKAVERMKKKVKGKVNIRTVKGKGWMLQAKS